MCTSHTLKACVGFCPYVYGHEKIVVRVCVVRLFEAMLCCGSTSRRQEAITPSPPRLSTPSKGDRYWNDGPPMSSPSIRWAIECMLMLWIIERTVTIDWLRIIGGLHSGMGRARRGWGMVGQKGRTGQNPAERFKYLLRLLTPKGPRSEVAWRARLTVWCFQPPPSHTHPTSNTDPVQSTLRCSVFLLRHTFSQSPSLPLPNTFFIHSFLSLSWLTVWLFTVACISQIWDRYLRQIIYVKGMVLKSWKQTGCPLLFRNSFLSLCLSALFSYERCMTWERGLKRGEIKACTPDTVQT